MLQCFDFLCGEWELEIWSISGDVLLLVMINLGGAGAVVLEVDLQRLEREPDARGRSELRLEHARVDVGVIDDLVRELSQQHGHADRDDHEVVEGRWNDEKRRQRDERNRVRDVLQQNRFTGLRRRGNQRPLSHTDRREQVHDAHGKVARIRLEVEFLVRRQRSEVVKKDRTRL